MESVNNKSQALLGFVGGVSLMMIALVVIYFVQQLSSSRTQKRLLEEQAKKIEELQKQIQDIPKTPEEKIAFPDFYVATKDMKRVTPISETTSFVNKTTNSIVGIKTITLSRQGKIARGYLLVKASVDSGRPLTIYDSVYVKLNYVGGHLLRNKSLLVPSASGTTLLYPLNSIPYLPDIPYNETRVGSTTDWLEKLNGSSEPVVLAFLSSAREGGLLKEITLAYECDKETPD